jgi:hypothetical protein
MTNRGPRITAGDVIWGPNRYPMVRVREDGKHYYFLLHRLVAYAHGIIDHPRFERDPREIHHVDEDKWNSNPDNLEAHTPEQHARITNGTHE